ncbi:type II secretion system protein GspM [Sphingomonas sp.]
MRVIRIVERDRIEAAIARFDAWWSGLTQRERMLVAVMAALIGTVVLVYGIVRPLQDARASARADIRTYETLNARIRAAGTLQPQGERRTGSPAEIVTAAAQAQALQPVIEPTPDGVRATLSEAPYDAVLNWIAEVSRSSGLAATRVEMARRPEPGMVQAVVDFAP